ncbi:MAG: hypothetical protein BWX84_00200 [Verrucomicrobia bacterium ADurb.Bin118]|nr:MAG: hypothetical protein BWX84_00200 [Verrucomicrobia bacterium ADurb.Bin118]
MEHAVQAGAEQHPPGIRALGGIINGHIHLAHGGEPIGAHQPADDGPAVAELKGHLTELAIGAERASDGGAQ